MALNVAIAIARCVCKSGIELAVPYVRHAVQQGTDQLSSTDFVKFAISVSVGWSHML